MKYLLDLNQTLVDREKNAPRIRPFELQIERETYRQWLVEILRNSYVILITARPRKIQTNDARADFGSDKLATTGSVFCGNKNVPAPKKGTSLAQIHFAKIQSS